MKSKPIPWTRQLFNEKCPCASGKKSYECCWRGNGSWERSPVGVINVGTSPFVNDDCYLSPLGGCCKKMTREHFVSRNILERITTSKLRFENAGHFFGGKNLVEISVDDFCAKVLCDNHNSALSVLDTAAGRTFLTVEGLERDCKGISASGPRVSSLHISSGIDMERWMVKVYCGLAAAKKIRSASGKTLQSAALERHLLESLVGSAALRDPLGLYVNRFVGQTLQPGTLSFGTIMLTEGSDEVGGLMLSLGVMTFVLVVSNRYGRTFHDPNWHRHQTLAWNVRQGNARAVYLFTY